jgi:hypothetical protein
LFEKRALAAVRIGRNVRVGEEDLAAFVERHRAPAVEVLADGARVRVVPITPAGGNDAA